MTPRTPPRLKVVVPVVIGMVVAGVLLLLVGVGECHVGIYEIGGEPASAVISMAVKSCNQDPRVEVDETEHQVRLSAFIDRPGLLDGQSDCLDQASVTLKSPLGARKVIDTSSDEVLVPHTE